MQNSKQAARDFGEIVARANAGEPQFIEGEEPCVLISLAEYQRLTGRANGVHLGRWLIENAPRIGGVDLPPRAKDRPVPFDDWEEEDFGE